MDPRGDDRAFEVLELGPDLVGPGFERSDPPRRRYWQSSELLHYVSSTFRGELIGSDESGD